MCTSWVFLFPMQGNKDLSGDAVYEEIHWRKGSTMHWSVGRVSIEHMVMKP